VLRKRIAGLGIAIAAMGAAGGAWTTASAQQGPEQSKALFTLLIDGAFNAGDLALADGLVARNVTNDGSRMDRDQVVEYWSLADEPALGRQLGLRAGPATHTAAGLGELTRARIGTIARCTRQGTIVVPSART
jgi:hypothetical protein